MKVVDIVVEDGGRPEEEEGGGDAGHQDVGAAAAAVCGLVGAGGPVRQGGISRGICYTWNGKFLSFLPRASWSYRGYLAVVLVLDLVHGIGTRLKMTAR